MLAGQCKETATMVGVTPTSVKTGPIDNPTPLEGDKLWTPKDGSAMLIEFDKPQPVDAIILDDKNSDQPQTFTVFVWFEPAANGKNPDKEVLRNSICCIIRRRYYYNNCI